MKRRIAATPRFNDRRIYLNRNMVNNLFYLNAGGISYPDKDFLVKKHYNMHYTVQYILSGKGFIDYDGKRHEMKAGDMFYLNAENGISYGTDPSDPFTKIWINGSGLFWKKTTEIFSFTEPFGIIPANDSVVEYFHRILDIAVLSEEKRELGMNAVTALYNCMYDIKNGSIRAEAHTAHDMAVEIKRYIDLHLCDVKKLSEIASRFELSQRTVYSKFKQSYGMTPAEYISECRLELARELLSGKDANITAIAEKTGFSGASYFCKVYKDKYGITPQQYRKNIKNSEI